MSAALRRTPVADMNFLDRYGCKVSVLSPMACHIDLDVWRCAGRRYRPSSIHGQKASKEASKTT
jgi:hypothetical protein